MALIEDGHYGVKDLYRVLANQARGKTKEQVMALIRETKKNICGAKLAVPVMKVPKSSHIGVVETHKQSTAPHLCTLEKHCAHIPHRCGMETNEIWTQYCCHEWE